MRMSSIGIKMTSSAPTPNTFRLPDQSPKLYKDNTQSEVNSPAKTSSISLMKQKPELRDKYDFNTVKGNSLLSFPLLIEFYFGFNVMPCVLFADYANRTPEGTLCLGD